MAELAACKTAGEVAALMRSRGVKGVPGQRQRCPVARLLNGGADAADFRVTGYHGSLVVLLANGRPLRLPDAVDDFVHRFDGLRYPDLVEQ